MRIGYDEIAAWTGGRAAYAPAAGARMATGLTWDSREVAAGDLYVALPGQRVDGHDFVAAALRAGASGAVVAREPDAAMLAAARETASALVVVDDAAAAITRLAARWRLRLRGVVVGLSGSSGKTTTKNLVRDVAAAGFSVVATRANQNNELGVPRTLLAADEDTEVVVVEMGMRGAGQIARLCEVVRPDWGLLTNVGEAHVELLGSVENIARAKAELLCALPPARGVAFVNGADAWGDFQVDAAGLAARGVEVVRFGAAPRGKQGAGRAVWAEDVRLDAQGRPSFTLCARGFSAGPSDGGVERHPCALLLMGLHNVSNACAAAAVGLALGMSLTDVARALRASQPEAGRQEVLRAPGGFTVVDDAYNANPDSMRAALATFCALDVPGRRIAVLGDMGELGGRAEVAHRDVGAFAAGLPLDELVCTGLLSRLIAQGARSEGMPSSRIVECADGAAALARVREDVRAGDAVLVKASHFMELDEVARGLVGQDVL